MRGQAREKGSLLKLAGNSDTQASRKGGVALAVIMGGRRAKDHGGVSFWQDNAEKKARSEFRKREEQSAEEARSWEKNSPPVGSRSGGREAVDLGKKRPTAGNGVACSRLGSGKIRRAQLGETS